ncbi:MAG: DUF502 domain-containing protein [Kiritimatiellae bacterium]|nr:DUF502 domain-containing protein [Kiritimatiellia bacterium]MDW8457534.1 DUF502 domain-containing protein [Verrucomicrobiota bacterium]
MSRSIFRPIRTNIIVGLILVTPIVVTAFVVNWLFTFITNRVLIFLPKSLREGDQELLWRIVSLVIVLLLLFLVGLFVRNILGKRIYKLGDRLLTQLPLINRIYIATRQIITSLVQQRKTLFQEAVVVEYPRPGIFSVGFITAVVPNEYTWAIRTAAPDEECVSVFIPTTPNPTSGWLCLVPRSSVKKLNMSTGEAMRLIVSGGAVFPGREIDTGSASLVELVHELIHSDSPQAPNSTPRNPTT